MTEFEPVDPGKSFQTQWGKWQKQLREWRSGYEDWRQVLKQLQEWDEKDSKGIVLKSLAPNFDVFAVADVSDIGEGEPLSGNFEFEDWALLSLKVELHLLVHNFRDDTGGAVLDESNMGHYYNCYFKKDLKPEAFAVQTMSEVIQLADDSVCIEGSLLEHRLPEDTAWVRFLKMTEQARRDRLQAFEAGDETVTLSFPGSGESQKPKKKPPHKKVEVSQPVTEFRQQYAGKGRGPPVDRKRVAQDSSHGPAKVARPRYGERDSPGQGSLRTDREAKGSTSSRAWHGERSQGDASSNRYGDHAGENGHGRAGGHVSRDDYGAARDYTSERDRPGMYRSRAPAERSEQGAQELQPRTRYGTRDDDRHAYGEAAERDKYHGQARYGERDGYGSSRDEHSWRQSADGPDRDRGSLGRYVSDASRRPAAPDAAPAAAMSARSYGRPAAPAAAPAAGHGREAWKERDYDYGQPAWRDGGSAGAGGRPPQQRDGYGSGDPAYRDRPAYGARPPASHGDGHSRDSHSQASPSTGRGYSRDAYSGGPPPPGRSEAYGKGSSSYYDAPTGQGSRAARVPPRPPPKKDVDPLDAFMAGIEVAGDSFAKGEVTERDLQPPPRNPYPRSAATSPPSRYGGGPGKGADYSKGSGPQGAGGRQAGGSGGKGPGYGGPGRVRREDL